MLNSNLSSEISPLRPRQRQLSLYRIVPYMGYYSAPKRRTDSKERQGSLIARPKISSVFFYVVLNRRQFRVNNAHAAEWIESSFYKRNGSRVFAGGCVHIGARTRNLWSREVGVLPTEALQPSFVFPTQ
jgi:hypothetical protein